MAQNSVDIVVYTVNENVFRVSRPRMGIDDPAREEGYARLAVQAADGAPGLAPGGDVASTDPDDARDRDTLRFTRGLVIGLAISLGLWAVLLLFGSSLVQSLWAV